MITAKLNDDHRTATLTVSCMLCMTPHVITVNQQDYLRWQRGELIQNVWPDMLVDNREMLISGICSTCFDAMFSDAPSTPEARDS